MKKPSLPDIFYNVCNQHQKARPIMQKPYICGNHVVSTDMSMIIIADKNKYDTSGLEESADSLSENTEKIINRIKQTECIKPWQKIDIDDDEIVSFMDAKVTHGECYECDGNGYVYLSTSFNEYEIECLSCDGTGDHPTIPIWGHVCVDQVRVNPCYIFLINNADSYNTIDNQLFFRIGEISGTVLGMR
ncbi:hypothetical protein [Nitrosomonas marina]|uniref:Uncharacterized protein n=1 Tax=Nitrosomonas marina TaxID=917 RepID=A0A1H8GK74_9PROT|nr:hypothetical protein [Nitrosomonas marina]SEN44210.1 hypothetical protein SAMN05216325_11862 [Nitrosomonas marina]